MSEVSSASSTSSQAIETQLENDFDLLPDDHDVAIIAPPPTNIPIPDESSFFRSRSNPFDDDEDFFQIASTRSQSRDTTMLQQKSPEIASNENGITSFVDDDEEVETDSFNEDESFPELGDSANNSFSSGTIPISNAMKVSQNKQMHSSESIASKSRTGNRSNGSTTNNFMIGNQSNGSITNNSRTGNPSKQNSTKSNISTHRPRSLRNTSYFKLPENGQDGPKKQTSDVMLKDEENDGDTTRDLSDDNIIMFPPPDSKNTIKERNLFSRYYRRAFHWKLNSIEPTVDEGKTMHFHQVPPNKLLRIYLVWRRTILMTAIPFFVFSFCLRVYDFMDDIDGGFRFQAYLLSKNVTTSESYLTDELRGVDYTAFGLLAAVSKDVVPTLIWLVGLLLSWYTWYELSLSVRILYYCAFMSQVFYFWPLVIQTENFLAMKVDASADCASADCSVSRTNDELEVFGVAAQSMKDIMMDVLPLILAFTRGTSSAAMATFGLVQGASVPGILVVYFAPFSTIILFFLCVIVAQLLGDWIFTCAVICFLLSDLRLFFAFNLLFRGLSEEFHDGNVMLQKCILNVLGVIFIFVWFGLKIEPCVSLAFNTQTGTDIVKMIEDDAGDKLHCALGGVIYGLLDVDAIFLRFGRSIADILTNLFITKIIFADLILRSLFLIEGDKVCKDFKLSYKKWYAGQDD